MNFDDLFGNFGTLTITGLAQGAIYALFALGYTLVYGVLRLINFAHSEVFMVGTFAALWTWGALGLDQNSQTPPLGPVIAGSWCVGLSSRRSPPAARRWPLERVAYRPLRRRNAPPLAFLITAIGASFVLSGRPFGVGTRRRTPFGRADR